MHTFADAFGEEDGFGVAEYPQGFAGSLDDKLKAFS
jgi:hypothetical protein